MDALPAYAEPVGYPLKSPTFLPQPIDGCVLSGIDLPVTMGLFEEESDSVKRLIFDSTDSHNDAQPLSLL